MRMLLASRKKYLQSDNHLLLLGDFNAKIGNDRHGIINGERDVIKHFNLEILNNKAKFEDLKNK